MDNNEILVKGKAIDKNSTSSMSQCAHDYLVKQMLTRELLPGDIINRRQIADKLGFSVAPVLEAIVQLERQGFLETLPRKGTRVRIVRTIDVFGQIILREALECQAARLYCGERIRLRKQALLEAAKLVDAAGSQSQVNWEMEIAFHSKLVPLAGCPALTKAFYHIMQQGLFYAINMLIPPPSQKRNKNAHVELLEALEQDDPDVAEKHLRKHLAFGKEAIYEMSKSISAED